MNRKLEIVDILVAIGMVATLFGGYLLFKASYGGSLAVTTSTQTAPHPPLKLMLQSMLQPAMGRAIVDGTILEHQFATDITQKAKKLARATAAATHTPIEGLDTIKAQAAQFKADHDAQVQYVMGKIIVNLTRQGVRAGVLSADNLSNKFNDRIIATAQAMGNLMNKQFAKNWQPRLGQWIIAAAQREQHFAGHVQEQIGKQTVELASTQHRYLTKSAEIKNQLGALTAAAVRTEAQPSNQFARFTRPEVNMQQALGIQSMPEMEVIEARAFPEIPFGYMIAAFAGLIVVFLLGFTFSAPRQRQPEDVSTKIQELYRDLYRKAV
ncbi:MAG: hypothetical protein NPIRA02_11460 [Nitrospirales bacterium]|nr:MAG: hypothetical protein NPIRA02_11460 [Nitrospirales bacterium]